MSMLKPTISATAKIFGSQRKLWLPFLLTAAVQVIILLLIWLAPQPPLIKYIAPPIRFFFGDRVLHYPWHLWFIYHFMKHAHVASMVIMGAFFAGLACVMAEQALRGQAISLYTALKSKRVRFGRMLLIWLTSWGIAKAIFTWMLPRILPQTAWAFLLSVVLMVLLQALLVYAIPAAIYERVSWWRALVRSIQHANKYPIPTLVIVTVTLTPIVLVSIFLSPDVVAGWMMQSVPEYVIGCIVLRMVVWTVTDAVLTLAAAYLWLLSHHNVEPKDGVVS